MPLSDQMLLIRRHDFFAKLSSEEYDSLNILHNYKEAHRNDYIYFEAEHYRNLYFVKEGFVKIGYRDKDGNEVIKEIIGSGDIFGQITLEEKNADGEFAQAYKSDVSLCMFRVDEFSKLLELKPQLAIRFAHMVGGKMNRLETRMINLLQRDVRSRLLYFFHSLSQQFKSNLTDNCFEMDNFLTHDDISRLIGSSRQTVTSMLAQLEQEKLVIFSRKRLEIPDVKKLQKLLSVG
jgi:CRP/FNR family cyclic AMP-dependent transcriptional regulator